MPKAPIDIEWQERFRAWLKTLPGTQAARDTNPGCMFCYTTAFGSTRYMVKDETWSEAELPSEPGTSCVCISCLADRLDRPLTIDDFPKHLPINEWIHFGYRLGAPKTPARA